MTTGCEWHQQGKIRDELCSNTCEHYAPGNSCETRCATCGRDYYPCRLTDYNRHERWSRIRAEIRERLSKAPEPPKPAEGSLLTDIIAILSRHLLDDQDDPTARDSAQRILELFAAWLEGIAATYEINLFYASATAVRGVVAELRRMARP